MLWKTRKMTKFDWFILGYFVLLLVSNFLYARTYNQDMRDDILRFEQRLIQQGMPQSQVEPLRSVLLDIKTDTKSYVQNSSFIIIMLFVGLLGMVADRINREKDES